MTRIAPLVDFVRKKSFVRSLVTVQGRYRTPMQRYSVRMICGLLAHHDPSRLSRETVAIEGTA